MNDRVNIQPPRHLERLIVRSREIAFSMNSDPLTGAFPRSLAASKPGAAILELGTGCGVGTSWLLDGMDARSTLVSIDTDPYAHTIAATQLGKDPRLTLMLRDCRELLESWDRKFDLIFADAWPGKYTHLDAALALLKHGGIYVVDDMLPQPNWPEGHGARAAVLIAQLEQLPGFAVTKMAWATGIILAVKQ